MVRVRTVTLLLLLFLGLSFALGAYEIYRVLDGHRGAHGHGSAQPLGLPEIHPAPPVSNRPYLRLGT